MMTIVEENGDDSVSVSTYSQSECQSKSRQNRPLSFFSDQLLKKINLKIDALGYHLIVLRTLGQVDK